MDGHRYKTVAFLSLALVFCGVAVSNPIPPSRCNNYTILAGTYNAALLRLVLDPNAPSLTLAETIPLNTSKGGPFNATNPSWLEPHPTDPRLAFAADQSPVGRVVLFRTSLNGSVSHVASAPSNGYRPAHVGTTKDGKWVFLPHYNDGHFVAIPVDVSAGSAAFNTNHSTLQVYNGTGPNSAQAGPHLHMAVKHPFSGRVFVVDLGSDRIHELRLNSSNYWVPVQSIVVNPPGTGPRHMRFSPDGTSAFLVAELASTLHTYRVASPPRGSEEPTVFTEVTVMSVAPPGAQSYNSSLPLGAGEILLTKDGTQLAVTIRNDANPLGDAIGMISLESPFSPTIVGSPTFYRTGGIQARGMEFDPTDRYLIAGNRFSASMIAFERLSNGTLLELARLNVTQGTEVATFLWVKE
ncbi:hypothetical protein HDU93_009164 [Gonapodya sp. JEL0774]|nr:hypothetical protein HDU93_009164 [Gonapodya sp. JEL0774]